MAEAGKPDKYYVVFVTTKFRSFDEARTRAADDIAAHLARSRQLYTEGKLLMAGAFLDRPDEPLSTMAVLKSREMAEEYIREDPFVLKGLVSDWYIREWANMLV